MMSLKSETMTILVKPSRSSGLGISSGLILDGKKNIVTDSVAASTLLTVCKSVTKNPSLISKFLVV